MNSHLNDPVNIRYPGLYDATDIQDKALSTHFLTDILLQPGSGSFDPDDVVMLSGQHLHDDLDINMTPEIL